MNSKEKIQIDGHTLRLVRYNGPLFRSDDKTRSTNRANEYYRGNNGQEFNKYFTKTEKEAKIYERPHLTKWIPSEPLRLVDMFDLETRLSLENLIHPRDLSISFPVSQNKNKPQNVYRFSEEDSIVHDNAVLEQICALGHNIDGYYMDEKILPLSNTGIKHPILSHQTIRSIFHSEIGVCKASLHKLRLENVVKRLVPPRIRNKPKPKTRNNHKNRRPELEEKKAFKDIFADTANNTSITNSITKNSLASLVNNDSNHSSNLNLTTMIESNRPFFTLSPLRTPTRKRIGNSPQTSMKKTPKRMNHNTPHTPPRKTVKRSLFPFRENKK
jgi:hypothetical protein